MKNKSFLKVVFAFFCLLLLVGCETYSQKPSDSFVEGKFPSVLENYANPQPTKRELEKILARLEQDSNRTDLLRVSVIDQGSDYLHPSLMSKVAFTHENGKLTGAGYDVLGGDLWAHPNLIDPSLFAFGAAKITVDGRIEGAQSNPLEYYTSLNDAFVKELVEAIQQHPVLSSSLFAMINEKSISLTGVAALLHEMQVFPNSEHERILKTGKVWDSSIRSNKLFNRRSEDFKKTVDSLLNREWGLGTDVGLPTAFGDDYSFLSNLKHMRHAKEFYQLVKKLYKKSKHAIAFQSAFNSYFEFKNMRRFDEETSDSSYKKHCIELLHEAYLDTNNHFDASNPLLNLLDSIRNQLDYASLVALEATPPSKRVSVGEKLIHKHFDQAQFALQYLIDSESVDRMSQMRIEKQLRTLDRFRNEVLKALTVEAYDYLVTGDVAVLEKQRLEFAKSFRHGSHPYVGDDSQGMSHGTHTASTLLAQDENDQLRLYPIRVLTSDMKFTHANLEQQLQEVLRETQEWVETPLVAEALYAELVQSELIDKASITTSLEKKKAAIRKFWPRFQDVFFAEQSRRVLERYFFLDLEEAIKRVGQEKIKVASVSLGLEHEEGIDEEDEDRDVRILKIADLLQSEFYKFKVGSAIKKYAPNTLFFVAAGNDSRWIDSQALNTMPADLSSPWLEKNRPADVEPAPNNQLNNIVAVLSLNKDRRLSSFTNIPITESTPIVGTIGEAVRAAVNLTDISAALERLSKKIYDAEVSGMALDPDDEQVLELALENGWIEADYLEKPELKAQRVIEAQGFLTFYSGQFLDDALEFLLAQRIASNTKSDAVMSGTSMATPNMAGYVAVLIAEKMKNMGLSEAEIWNHPEFSPQVLIKELIAKLDKFGGNSLVRELPVLWQPKLYKPVRGKKPCQLILI